MYIEFKDYKGDVIMSRYSNKNIVVVNDRDDGCSVQFKDGCDSNLVFIYKKLMDDGRKTRKREEQRC